MLNWDLSGLRVAVEGNSNFAGFLWPVWRVTNRPLMNLTVGPYGWSRARDVALAEPVVIGGAKVVADLARTFNEDGEKIRGRGLLV